MNRQMRGRNLKKLPDMFSYYHSFLLITQDIGARIDSFAESAVRPSHKDIRIQEIISRLCTILMNMYFIIYIECVHSCQFQPLVSISVLRNA